MPRVRVSPYTPNLSHHNVIHSLDRKRITLEDKNHWKVPPEITIVGFDRIRNNNYCLSVRCLWFCFIIFCTVYCTVMLWYCTDKYLSEPTIKRVKIVRDFRVKFPAMYLCPGVGRSLQHYFLNNRLKKCTQPGNYSCLNDPFAEIVFQEFTQLMDNQTSVEAIWDKLYFTLKLFKPCQSIDAECTKDGREFTVESTFVKTFWGTCVVLNTVSEVVYRGPLSFFEVEITNLHYINVTQKLKRKLDSSRSDKERKSVLSALERHTVGILFFLHQEYTSKPNHAVFFSSHDVLQGFQIHAEIKRSDYKLLNTTKSKCVDKRTRAECVDKCLEAKLTTLCRMPYSQRDIKYCTLFNFEQAHMENFETYSTFNYAKCKCLPACAMTKFTSTVDVIDKLTGNEEMIRIKFYFAGETYEDSSEHLAYGLTLFLSDVAGTLGFFLGFCCLNALEFVEFFIYLCWSKKKTVTVRK